MRLLQQRGREKRLATYGEDVEPLLSPALEKFKTDMLAKVDEVSDDESESDDDDEDLLQEAYDSRNPIRTGPKIEEIEEDKNSEEIENLINVQHQSTITLIDEEIERVERVLITEIRDTEVEAEDDQDMIEEVCIPESNISSAEPLASKQKQVWTECKEQKLPNEDSNTKDKKVVKAETMLDLEQNCVWAEKSFPENE
jgi:hypothetical protein